MADDLLDTQDAGAAPGVFLVDQRPENNPLLVPPRRRLGSVNARVRRVLVGALVPILLVALWQALDSLHVFSAALIPPPTTVLHTLGDWLGVTKTGQGLFYQGKLIGDLHATVQRVVVGFALAAVVGVGLGTAIGVSRWMEELLTPLFRILGPIPAITWIPVAIVVLGLGERTNYFLTFLGAVFPIIAASATAVSGVGRDLLRAGRMLGRNRVGIVVSVVLPSAMPGIVGGLRIGLGLAWMMAVTSEMLAVHSGLGYTLWNAYNYLDYPAVFAAMIVTGLGGLITDSLLRAATNPMVRWHHDTGVRS
jgi:NitT/TauT family transport system permease protein